MAARDVFKINEVGLIIPDADAGLRWRAWDKSGLSIISYKHYVIIDHIGQ